MGPTSKTKIHDLADCGQSIWLDHISRSLLTSSKLQNLIDQGILGMTSNPTIFYKAISFSQDYDEQIASLSHSGKNAFDIYDELAVKDIQQSADFFMPVYQETNRRDGYVSLEINPLLAEKEEESVQEGLRLFAKVGRPNLMIKVPVTQEGPKIIEELISRGINVNATLIFSSRQYWEATSAFLKGLERHKKFNEDFSKVHSVASVFVSRIDTAIDNLIHQKMTQESGESQRLSLESLLGKSAVANSVVIYDKFQQMFSSNYFQVLKQDGAQIQRVLWASTGTKNPLYSDIKYVTELIGEASVNTLPEKTLTAFVDHGRVAPSLPGNLNKAQEIFNNLNQHSINIDDVCAQLLKDGLSSFCQSFEQLISAIQSKAEMICEKK